MAYVKPVSTYNGVPTTSKSWVKVNLTGELLDHWNAVKKARAAFEAKLTAAIRNHAKVTPQHEVVLGFKYGPSYMLVDKTNAPKPGTVTI